MVNIRNSLAACFLLLLNLGYAEGKKQNFYRNLWSPTYHIQRLSYCTADGKACGLAVANRYCKLLGYQKAVRAIEEPNIGVANYIDTRTRCIGWHCNGFELIRCADHFSHQPPKNYFYRASRFPYPRFDHYRVNWCYEKGKGCGKRAADSFCRRLGYSYASHFTSEKAVPATKTLGNHQLCFGQTCQGFKEITCYR